MDKATDRVLFLILTEHWFDEIKSGRKTAFQQNELRRFRSGEQIYERENDSSGLSGNGVEMD